MDFSIKVMEIIHRHPIKIDCLLVVVGGPTVGAESGGIIVHWPASGAIKCFITGNITTTVNKGGPGQ